MNDSTHYILNPNYLLFSDVDRCLLTDVREDQRDHTIEFEQNCSRFIHPLQAQMLSFFNGEEDLRGAIQKISDYFDLNASEIRKIILPYMENSEGFSMRQGDHRIEFPKQMLVPKGNAGRYRNYTPDDFPIPDRVDLTKTRLNIPRYFLFVLNTDCYTDCLYCYADKKHEVKQKLGAERIIELIDEIESLGGAVSIDINGGEIPMHEGNLKVIKHLMEKNYDPLVSTKMPLTPRQVERLAHTGLRKIQVSLDTPNPNVIPGLLGVKKGDYYDRMLAMLAEFDRLGVEIRIHPVLTKFNSDIPDIEKLLNDTLAFRKTKAIHFTPAGYSLFKGEKAYREFKPTKEALDKVWSFIQPYAQNHPDRSISIAPPPFLASDYADPEKKKELFAKSLRCSGNQRTMSVMPDGKTTLCEEMYWHPRFILGDLSKQSILEAWNSDAAWELYNLSQTGISEKSACKTCKQFKACRGTGRNLCWKYVQYFYGRENWDFPEPSCPFAPPAYQNCMI